MVHAYQTFQQKYITTLTGRRLAMQELRMMIVLLTLSFKCLSFPESLSGMEGRQRVLRSPQQSYVKVEVM